MFFYSANLHSHGVPITIFLQHLYERAWYAVTETCLAMTIFRDEFDTKFVVTFTTLLFLKIFHWLCQDRIEFVSGRYGIAGILLLAVGKHRVIYPPAN